MSSTENKQKIVICGAGNAAHIFTGLASQDSNNEVHLLSLYKTEAADFKCALSKTNDKLLTIDIIQTKKQIKSAPFNITNDPKCLDNSDIVIISLPAFAHNQYLNAIKTNIKPQKNTSYISILYYFPYFRSREIHHIHYIHTVYIRRSVLHFQIFYIYRFYIKTDCLINCVYSDCILNIFRNINCIISWFIWIRM